MRGQESFLDAATLLENTGVAAYNGQAANLTKKSLAAAAAIVSVEGRHAAWISSLAGRDPAPRAAIGRRGGSRHGDHQAYGVPRLNGPDSRQPELEEIAATLADVDTDGALRETGPGAFPGTRAVFLRRSVSALAAAGFGGLFAAEQKRQRRRRETTSQSSASTS